jgi:Ca2+:H+ antiporter
MPRALKPSLSWLLVFVPVVVALELLAPERHTLIFFLAGAAIIPLAGWMGRATEHLAERTGEGIGGLLNATFGNAAEMIIAIVALRKGLVGVVKASLTGSILGNVLLVMGAAVLAGGVRHEEQEFNETGTRAMATMLTLAAIALIAPAAYHHIVGSGARASELQMSADISWVLLATYAASLLFSLRTHRRLFTGQAAAAAALEDGEGHQPWSFGKALLILGAATGLVAWMSEILVGSVEATAHALGMTDVFIGVVVVAIIGNAAEHSTAVMMAVRNRMDLAMGIAIGSSVQIALFVAPVLVLLSPLLGPRPMDLVFTLPEVLAIAVTVVIAGQIAGDGRSNWLEGVQLLAVYVILGIVFYFLPG